MIESIFVYYYCKINQAFYDKFLNEHYFELTFHKTFAISSQLKATKWKQC
jgi:hypothetical protein